MIALQPDAGDAIQPDKLRGSQLSLEARIVAVADFYSALVEDRPYRTGMSHAEAMTVLRAQALDKDCVEAGDSAHRARVPDLRRRLEPAPSVASSYRLATGLKV